MKEFKEFILKILSGESDVSSKRLAGLVALGTAIILSFIDTFGHKINEHLFDGFLLFAAASLGLTIADNWINKKTNL